ncbi:hypothetical protein [Photobacterium kishitanii]|uniref:Uncharacterized protein n=1 Tax=Photobacterium kishitanii TaxID=318456 RepID=A0A2T3KL74_9GAMM|nr:hypothetical protein [Photobacterium kishitanii]PSV00397.1 hypothetical protein C9J27_04515 [Photobacterium kishitanii]
MGKEKHTNPAQIGLANKSDFDIATKVRALLKTDLDHEAVCVASHDRILYLSQKVARMEKALLEIESCPFGIDGFPSASEAAGWMNDRATTALDPFSSN